jgi:transposase
MPQDFTVAVEDESIFIHDVLIRRKMWTPQGVRPTVTITGSHQKTCVFGTFSMDGRQLFRQYPVFNQDTFLSYLKEILGKFGRLILFIDRAVQHYRSVKVIQYLQDNSDRIKVEYLPKGSPEFNAVEECWRQGKDHLLVSRYYPKFEHLKDAIGKYYRTRRFKLDITKYLLRSVT